MTDEPGTGRGGIAADGPPVIATPGAADRHVRDFPGHIVTVTETWTEQLHAGMIARWSDTPLARAVTVSWSCRDCQPRPPAHGRHLDYYGDFGARVTCECLLSFSHNPPSPTRWEAHCAEYGVTP